MTPPEIGSKYDVLEKLADGGMGQVFKVRHRHLDQIQAIKVLHEAVDDPTTRKRFVKEARNASQLRHPNIVQLIDFEVPDSGSAYIVMEFIEGMTVSELLERAGPPPVPAAVEIARQGLTALSYLHDRNLIHRDVAADNFMLTRGTGGELVVKLIDLGIAKHLGSESSEQLTAAATFLGKARYTAPEQFKEEGARHLTRSSDVYSFGVVLYELLTGRSPIVGEDLAAIFAAHLFEPPLSFEVSDPAGRVPPELRALVLRALEKDPAKRYESAGAMLAELLLSCDVAGSCEPVLAVLGASARAAELDGEAPPGSQTEEAPVLVAPTSAEVPARAPAAESVTEAPTEALAEPPKRVTATGRGERSGEAHEGRQGRQAGESRAEASVSAKGDAAPPIPPKAETLPRTPPAEALEDLESVPLSDRLKAQAAAGNLTETVVLRAIPESKPKRRILPWLVVGGVVVLLLVLAWWIS